MEPVGKECARKKKTIVGLPPALYVWLETSGVIYCPLDWEEFASLPTV